MCNSTTMGKVMDNYQQQLAAQRQFTAPKTVLGS